MLDNSTVSFGKLLLVGLGSDGAHVLSLIAQTVNRNFPNNISWRENILMVAVGVREIEPLPADLDPIITSVELESNVAWFRGLDAERLPLYLEWWKEAGMPSSGRGLARLAFFNEFKDESSNSLLDQVLIKIPRQKEIKDYFIITSLSDLVGSAIMWDVVHLLERPNAEQMIRSSSVLWLAIKGYSNTSDVAPYSWRELVRLGNGGSVNAFRNRFSQNLNRGHLTNGLDRIVIVNDSPNGLRQIQEAVDSSQLLAEVIQLALIPPFSQAFINDWVPAIGKRQELALNISTVSHVAFFIPANLIKDICHLRLIRSLLWDGISKEIPGMFDPIIPNLEGTQFSPKAFWARIIQNWNLNTQRVQPGGRIDFSTSLVSKERLSEFNRYLLSIVNEILNGDAAERDQQRKALAGKLSMAISFLDSLQIIIAGEKLTSMAELGKITQDLLGVLNKWAKLTLGHKEDRNQLEAGHVQIMLDERLQNRRNELRTSMQAYDRHHILVHPGTDERLWEDTIYNEWVSYLLGIEKPGVFDPISNLLDEVRWICVIENDSFKVKLSIGKDAKGSNISFELNELMTGIEHFKRLVMLKTGNELLSEGLEKRLTELFQPNEMHQVIQKSGNAWMEAGGLNALHIIGADPAGVALLSRYLKTVGRESKTYDNSAGDPNQISVVSIRDSVDQSTLFKFPVRTPQKSKFVYSAEMAYSDLERVSLLGKVEGSSNLSEQFTYFLSDPTLARIFGNGLLLGYITYRYEKFIYKGLDSTREIFFGAEMNQRLFYRDHPLLAAMEDFVIETSGKVEDLHHPLHPESRKETIKFEEKMLMSKGNGTLNEIEERYEKVLDYIYKYNAHRPIINTFQIWLQLLKNKILDN